MNEAYQTGLLDLAVATGGSAEFSRTPADIPQQIERAFANASRLQVADLDARPGRKPRPLKIAVDAAGQQVQSRPSYSPVLTKEK